MCEVSRIAEDPGSSQVAPVEVEEFGADLLGFGDGMFKMVWMR